MKVKNTYKKYNNIINNQSRHFKHSDYEYGEPYGQWGSSRGSSLV